MKLVPKFQNGNKFYYRTKNVDTGDIYNVYPSAIGAKNLIAEGTLPEVIVPGNKPYKSAFHSEDTLDFINALTGNILGRLSPTQTGRAIYDTFDNDLSDKQKLESWFLGNNGIVSDKYTEEHPISSALINLVGDAGTYLIGVGIAKNFNKPKIRYSTKRRPKTRNLTYKGVTYKVDNDVPEWAFNQHMADNEVTLPDTRIIPDLDILQANPLIELENSPYKGLLIRAYKSGDDSLLNLLSNSEKRKATKILKRARKGQDIVNKQEIMEYSNMQSMPEKEMKQLNYSPVADGIQGVRTPSGAYLNDIYSPNAASTSLHEAEHGYQQFLHYTNNHRRLLKKTYNTPKRVLNKDSRLLVEKGASNMEYRRLFWRKLGAKSFEDFKTKLQSLKDEDILKLFKEADFNDYIEEYKSTVNNLKPEQLSEWIQNFKKSLITVPVVSGLIYKTN